MTRVSTLLKGLVKWLKLIYEVTPEIEIKRKG
jgi:hypothetical protein